MVSIPVNVEPWPKTTTRIIALQRTQLPVLVSVKLAMSSGTPVTVEADPQIIVKCAGAILKTVAMSLATKAPVTGKMHRPKTDTARSESTYGLLRIVETDQQITVKLTTVIQQAVMAKV